MRKGIISRVFLYLILLVGIIATIMILGRFKWKGYTTVKESEDFIIYADTDIGKVKQYNDFLVSFKESFEENFFVVSGYKKLKIYIFTDQDEYHEYSKRIGYDTPYGFYLRNERLLAFNQRSGIGTLLHEVVHHFNYCSGREYPHWFNEGFAAFFEKFVAQKTENNTYTFSFGYFSPWRFDETYNILAYADGSMDDFIGQERPYQSLGRSFVLFMYKKGLLHDALGKITKGKDDRKVLEEIFGKKIEDIEEEWFNWVRESHADSDVQLIDSSVIVDRSQLAHWIRDKKVVWDPVDKVYTTHK